MTFPAPPHADRLRERLQRQLDGSFVITRELGGGGSARVFLATEIALDRAVVLKVLPPELTRGIDAERFRREILIAARLQHPHLVPLLTAGSATDEATEGDAALRWFSMPFVDGQTLREHLATHAPLAIPESVRLLRALASALAYAHGRGVMHRDIKPENILLSDGVAMIADFGVAKALDDASQSAIHAGRRITTASTTLGTPAYMAPEQISGALEVDHRADLYAFGCVAYEMLTGVPPLLRGSLRATMAAQINDRPLAVGQLRPDLPAALDALIMRCLHKEPGQRQASAAAIVEALDHMGSIALRPETSTPPDAPTPTTKAVEPRAPVSQAATPTANGTGTGARSRHLGLLIILVLVAAMVFWGIASRGQ